MEVVDRLVKTQYLKSAKLLEIAERGRDVCMSYDEVSDVLLLMIVPPTIETVVHYLDEHMALLYEPDSLEVVGFQVEAFRHSFLRKYNSLASQA